MSQKFFTQRFYLDTPVNRYTQRGGAHFVGPFRSFWVSDAKDSSFKCDIVINPTDEQGRGMPLRLNQCQAIGKGEEDKAQGGCIEFDLAQPGKWIEITFAQDDVIQVGSVAISINGKVEISEGSSHASIRKDVLNNTTTELIPASDQRVLAVLQLKSGGTFWIGTPTELANADYKNICRQISLSPLDTFEWRNSSALNVKTDSGALIFSLMQEIK